ncbi:ubiquinone biosynthesis regulatory protein kinase UbiB [Agarilytica rhodophyticola]|uniref:ubiquinone biosynthesis regulatory protein kinase UbiB n=1 Tax=Agarilytica rhodophyticola TaxID=1737490 RepID=UPI000B341509|nr:ubiquinone biosynthesis regulatory protein kinase UbiB [Agarilytica rhodophyticola]
MSTLLRFLKIIHTIGRYRLDLLLENSNIPKKFVLLLLPFKLYPTPQQNRGQRLRYALEELGPIFVKFGQLLSTRPDLIAADIVQELDHLQDNVAPFDNREFKNIVENALGASVDNIFASFEHSPLASASVAQVHAAKLKNGDDVVVKVVRPNIEQTIAQDIHLLTFFAQTVERINPDGKRLRPVEVVDDYRNTIFDELNLSLEASNATQLRRNFESSSDLYIPQVYWEYSNSNVMVMERIYGIPVTNVEELVAQKTNLKVLAEKGVEIFFTQVFEHNFFHADMHPGNVFVSYNSPENPSYIAVDMAIVGSLTKEDQYYLARNLLAMFRRDYRQVATLHVMSGWVPKGTSVSGFESAIRAVCEPIFEKPLKEISFGEALITIFKIAGRYNMPVQPQLVLLQKTLLNIEGLGRQLYPELNLWDTAHPFLERWIKQRFHPKTLWKEFRYQAPEWMEKLPEMPHLMFNTVQEVKSLAENAPLLIEASESLARSQRSKRKARLLIALLAISSATYLSWPTLQSLEVESLILLAIAFMALLI